jgi:hypothetical protein
MRPSIVANRPNINKAGFQLFVSSHAQAGSKKGKQHDTENDPNELLSPDYNAPHLLLLFLTEHCFRFLANSSRTFNYDDPIR